MKKKITWITKFISGTSDIYLRIYTEEFPLTVTSNTFSLS